MGGLGVWGEPARRPAVIVAVAAALTLAGAWTFQAAGFPPCELCLKERFPYYVGVPIAVLAAIAVAGGRWSLARTAYGLLALTFLTGAALGAYHAGVEWGFWPGPSECTGGSGMPPAADFLNQLQKTSVIRCDAAALRILGLSLAGWNAVIAAVLCLLAVTGWQRCARRL